MGSRKSVARGGVKSKQSGLRSLDSTWYQRQYGVSKTYSLAIAEPAVTAVVYCFVVRPIHQRGYGSVLFYFYSSTPTYIQSIIALSAVLIKDTFVPKDPVYQADPTAVDLSSR